MFNEKTLSPKELARKEAQLRQEAQSMLDHADALEAEGRALAAEKHAVELRGYVARRHADNDNGPTKV